MRAVGRWILGELERTGSTRACAVLRMLVMGVIIYWTFMRDHPALVDTPLQRGLVTTMGVFAVLGFIGFETRLSTGIVAAIYAYLHLRWGLLDTSHSFHHGVQECQSTFYVALLPTGKSMSVDRWLEVREARARGEEPPAEEGPLWALWIVVLSMSCLYFWAGIDKIDPDWWAGRRMDRLLMHNWGSSDSFGRYPGLLTFAAKGLAAGATVLELSLAFGLMIPRLWRYMVFVGLALHLGIWMMLGVFPYTQLCLAAYVVLIPPEQVHAFFDDLVGVTPEGAAGPASEAPASSLSSSSADRGGPQLWLRIASLAVFVGWCWQGPIRDAQADARADAELASASKSKQPFDATTWEWSLTAGTKRQICDLRYYERGDAGDVPIVRWQLLGYESAAKMKRADRAVSKRSVPSHTARLCKKLSRRRDGAPVDLRGQIHCPTKEGWEQVEDMSRNLCAGRQPASARGR